jgi:hypothetical protein
MANGAHGAGDQPCLLDISRKIHALHFRSIREFELECEAMVAAVERKWRTGVLLSRRQREGALQGAAASLDAQTTPRRWR